MRVPGARRLVLKTRYLAERVRERTRALWHRGPRDVPLEEVQRRLELVLTAMYGKPIPIATAEDPGWNRERVRNLAKGSIRSADIVPSMDGATIYLPDHLSMRRGDQAPLARFRLFAIEQAERIMRGTAAQAPSDRLVQDLYLLREGAVIDARIAEAHPGMAGAIGAERQAVLADRPALDGLTPAEREVELLLRDALTRTPNDAKATDDAAASRAWAENMAKRIRLPGVRYGGISPVSHWGTLHSDWKPSEQLLHNAEKPLIGGQFDTALVERADGEQTQENQESTESEDPIENENAGSTPTDEIDEQGGSANSNNEETQALEELDGNRPLRAPDLDTLPAPIYYDEWNSYGGAYLKKRAAVRLYPAEEGSLDWATDALRQQASTVRQVRQQFERLRARRMLLTRQRTGADLDIRACVDAIVDRRIGDAPDDRLYLDARPARRGLAIALLVDVSGSTEQRVSPEWRIIDLEKIAVLLATQALDALGDLYAVYSFGGKTADNVAVTVVKDFAERSGETVQRRIAALKPNGYTRLGAAVRHATHQLARQPAGRRLLLLLSDGRPNDLDLYQGPYGAEDSRQAIFEARASGVYPFCLTIDREASEYLPRIFGQAGHTILQRPAQLPTALLHAVRTLIKR